MNALKDVRQKLGITQEEAAEKIGISVSLLQKIEQGVKNGNDETKIKVAKFYKLPVGYLFFGEVITNCDDGLDSNLQPNKR